MNREALKDILDDAVKMAPEARAPYLDAACAGDAALRHEVQSLLGAYDHAPRFMTNPTAGPNIAADEFADTTAAAVAEEADAAAGAMVGPYKLLQRIGEGGFGAVYLAEQREPVQRRVALKIIKLGMDTRQVIARFEAERQALAMMDHPNIARVLDAGSTDAQSPLGPCRPYFVMELVKGAPVTQFCDQHQLALRERLALFADVCHAVQHAHQKGIIHRDLKPTNVLVSRFDDKPVVKIIDFGIAKATAGSGPLTDKTLFTGLRQLIGTPTYMSPEQAGLSDLDVDTRSDIYSLGVLLYELLTGTTPFDAARLRSADFDELRRIIREEEPPKPSARLSSLLTAGTKGSRDRGIKGSASVSPARAAGARFVNDSSAQFLNPSLPQSLAAARGTDPHSLSRSLRGDLDWIVMKCLEKDRTRRYPTANDLASDLERHLHDEPVAAGPPSRLYRLHKMLRRHRGPAAVAATFVALLTAATTLSVTLWQRADHDRAAAARQADDTELAATLLADMIGSTDPHETKIPSEVMLARLDRFAVSIDQKLAGHPAVEARVRQALGNAYRSIGEPTKAEPHLARALGLYRELYTAPHLRLASAIHDWAWLLMDKANYSEAETLHREALAMRRALLGNVHLDVAYSLDYLGAVLRTQKEFVESEAALRESLAIVEGLFGPEDRELTGTLEELFFTLRDACRDAEAEAVARRSIAVNRKVWGDEHARTAKMLCQLGAMLIRAQGCSEGIPILHESVQIFENIRDPDDLDLAWVRSRLADALGHCRQELNTTLAQSAVDAYRARNSTDRPEYSTVLAVLGELQMGKRDLEGAEATWREQVALARNNPKQYVPLTDALWRLADVLIERQSIDEADTATHEALELRRKEVGPDHLDIAYGLCRLAWLRAEKRADYAGAEQLYREALTIYRKLLGDDHPQVARALTNVAAVIKDKGDPAAAEPLFREALAITRRQADFDRGQMTQYVIHLAETLVSLERTDEAKALALECSAAYRSDAAWATKDAYHAHHLADMLREFGCLDEAEFLARKAVATYCDSSSAELTEHRHSVDVLAQVLSGRPDDAIALRLEFVDDVRRRYPDNEQALADALGPLGLLLLEAGNYDEAETVMREALAIRERLLKPEAAGYWLLPQTRSILGGALVGRAAALMESHPEAAIQLLAQAEPLIRDSHEWLSSHAERITPQWRSLRLRQSNQRVVRLYEAWDAAEPGRGYAAKAAEWRQKLETHMQTPTTTGPSP